MGGFGFIHAEGHDFFVHHSDIKMTGWRSLTPGVPVEFELREDKGRVKAVEVTAPTGPRKSEQRTIKICAADLKGQCHRGAHCRFAHVADVAKRGPVVGKRASLGEYPIPPNEMGAVEMPWGIGHFAEELRGY